MSGSGVGGTSPDLALSVLAAADQAADAAALIDRGRVVTWRQLAGEAMGWLESLLGAGWIDRTRSPEVRLAVIGHSDRSTLACLLGLIEIGEPFLLLHPRLTESECVAIGAVCGIDRTLETASPSSGITPPSATKSVLPELVQGRPPAEEAATLAVLHTSGTSGRPRAVRLSRRAVLASARASAANLGWRGDDRWLLSLPVAHVGGLSILTRAMIARRTVVLAVPGSFRPESLVETVERDHVTLLSLVPTMLHRLLELEPGWQPPDFVRAILLGGAAASPTLLGAAADRGWPVLTTYGMTETCSQMATQSPGTTNRGEAGSGKPLDGFEIEIAHARGSRGVEGPIRVRGAALFDGYVKTEDSGEPSPFEEQGWFDTGDVGFLDDAGHLHVLGRAGEMIVSGGENVSPLEVEAALESHPGIAGAVVVGVADEEWGERVAAVLVAAAGPLTDSEVRAFLAPRLSGFKHPRWLVWLEALPLTAGGKLDRSAARRLVRLDLGMG